MKNYLSRSNHGFGSKINAYCLDNDVGKAFGVYSI